MADQKFKSKVKAQGGLNLPQETVNRVPVVDASGDVVSSAVTDTELGHVSGVTSSIQTQLNTNATSISDHLADTVDAHDASAISNVPAGNLAATDVQGALDELQGDVDTINSTIAALPDPMEYKGLWDASTNTPTLSNGSGDNGDVYHVSVGGSVDFGAGAIVFVAGDKVVYNGASGVYEKWDLTDAVSSVNGQTGAVVLDSDDVSEGVTNLYFLDERAQDAVGTILVDSSSIDFTYTDATPEITAVVLPAGVDHDALANFVANEHVDHSSVSIATAVDSGLTGGGDITATRNLSVDINGTTALGTTPASGDSFLVWDADASALKKVTYTEVLGGVVVGSAGDITETSFSLANNQVAAADVTGLAFNAVVRGFKALVSVEIDATLGLYETFELVGINKAGTAFDMAVSAVGDESGVTFTITSAGQVQYTSSNYSGFVSGAIKFRAETTSV